MKGWCTILQQLQRSTARWKSLTPARTKVCHTVHGIWKKKILVTVWGVPLLHISWEKSRYCVSERHDKCNPSRLQVLNPSQTLDDAELKELTISTVINLICRDVARVQLDQKHSFIWEHDQYTKPACSDSQQPTEGTETNREIRWNGSSLGPEPTESLSPSIRSDALSTHGWLTVVIT